MEKENRRAVLLFQYGRFEYALGGFLQRMSEIFVAQLIFAEVWAYRDFLLNSAFTSLHG